MGDSIAHGVRQSVKRSLAIIDSKTPMQAKSTSTPHTDTSTDTEREVEANREVRDNLPACMWSDAAYEVA